MSATSEQMNEELRTLEAKIAERVANGEPIHHEDRVKLNELRAALQATLLLTEGKGQVLKG